MKKFYLTLIAILFLVSVNVASAASSGAVGQPFLEIWKEIEAVKQSIKNIQLIPGPSGRDGIDGQDGADGKDGTDGRDGIDGAAGRDGTDGRDGIDGRNGTDGAPGAPGNNLGLVDANGQDLGILLDVENGEKFHTYLPEIGLTVVYPTQTYNRRAIVDSTTIVFDYAEKNCQGVPYGATPSLYLIYKVDEGGKYYRAVDRYDGSLVISSKLYPSGCVNLPVPQATPGITHYEMQEISLPFAEPLAFPLRIVERTGSPLPQPEPEPTPPSIVDDTFDGYTNGPLVGRGGWASYKNGGNFQVQDAVVYDGTRAVYVNALADSVVTRQGQALADGRQTFHFRTQGRSGWGNYPDGNLQVRVSKNPWASDVPTRVFCGVSFKSDGHAAYYDPATDAYVDFAAYADGAWVKLDIEWRAVDQSARYRLDDGAWTGWHPFSGASSFTDFDNVGVDFILPGGSGGAYFDSLH